MERRCIEGRKEVSPVFLLPGYSRAESDIYAKTGELRRVNKTQTSHSSKKAVLTSKFSSFIPLYTKKPIAFIIHLQNQISSIPLLGGINNITTSNSTLVHQIINHLQLRKTDNLEGRFNNSTAVELQCLGGIASVSDVGSLDGDHLDDALEDRCAQVGACWETDADDCSAWSDVL